jgi:hypothetical protein
MKNRVIIIVTAAVAFALAISAITVFAVAVKNNNKNNSSKQEDLSVSERRNIMLENDSELLDLKLLSREQLIELLGERDEDGYRQLDSDLSERENQDYFTTANYRDVYKTETRTVIFEFSDLRRSCTIEEQADGEQQLRTIYNTRQFRDDIDPELTLSEAGNTALARVQDELRSFQRGQLAVKDIEALLGSSTLRKDNVLYYLDGWVAAWVNSDDEIVHLSYLMRESDSQNETFAATLNHKTGELYWEIPIF